MPNIRVTCPACNTTLELDAQYAGQEVECGSCLHVFVAAPPAPAARPPIRGARPKPAPRRGTPPRTPAPRDDADYPRDPYDDGYADPRPAGGLGTAALVLGILSIVAFCCWPVSGLLGVLAVGLGALGRRNPLDRGSATAGLTLGVVGLVLTVGFVALVNERWNPPFLR